MKLLLCCKLCDIQGKQKQTITQKLQVCSNIVFLISLNTILKPLCFLEID